MTARLACAVLVLAGLVPMVAAAEAPVRPDNGPILQVDVAPGTEGVTVEFRYAFSLPAEAELYLKNNPAPYNAAFRDGWTTEAILHSESGPIRLGNLVSDHPMELGGMAAGKSYGLALLVRVPASDLAQAATLNLTYVLAAHAASTGNTSGASLDPSVGIYLQAIVTPGAGPQALEPWLMPGWPVNSDDSAGLALVDGQIGRALAATAIAFVLLAAGWLMFRRVRQKG